MAKETYTCLANETHFPGKSQPLRCKLLYGILELWWQRANFDQLLMHARTHARARAHTHTHTHTHIHTHTTQRIGSREGERGRRSREEGEGGKKRRERGCVGEKRKMRSGKGGSV